MKLFCASILMTTLILSALSPTFAAAAAAGAGTDDLLSRSPGYATGCIPTPSEEWIRLGVYPLPDEENGCRDVRISTLGMLSAGMLSVSSLPSVKVWDTLPPAADIPMSAVKHQLGIGSCSSFALAACIESMFGINISEAELYMRVKTQRGSDRKKEGTSLGDYINILREGVLLESHFPSYASYDAYVKGRKEDARIKKDAIGPSISTADPRLLLPFSFFLFDHQMMIDIQQRRLDSNILTSSELYKPSIEDFNAWCERQGHPKPKDLKPTWKEDTYEVRVDDDFVPTPVRVGLCYLNPLYWAVRALSDDPALRFERSVTRTRIVLDPTSYYRLPLRMYTLKAYDPTHPSKDKLYRLKHALANGFRVALAIKTFAKYKRKPDGTYEIDRRGNKVIQEQWLTEGAKAEGYIIGLPPVPKEGSTPTPDEYEVEGAHAICVCAYDDRDARKAIRFKNSWGTTYADHGYAWLSYDYLQQPGYFLDGWTLKKEGR